MENVSCFENKIKTTRKSCHFGTWLDENDLYFRGFFILCSKPGIFFKIWMRQDKDNWFLHVMTKIRFWVHCSRLPWKPRKTWKRYTSPICIFWTLHSTEFYSFYVIICRNELYRSCQIHILNNVSGFEHKIKNTKIQFIFIKPGPKMTRFACCFNFIFKTRNIFQNIDLSSPR